MIARVVKCHVLRTRMFGRYLMCWQEGCSIPGLQSAWEGSFLHVPFLAPEPSCRYMHHTSMHKHSLQRQDIKMSRESRVDWR